MLCTVQQLRPGNQANNQGHDNTAHERADEAEHKREDRDEHWLVRVDD
jgi:hypothetical protein